MNRVVSAAVGRLSMEKEGVVVMNTQGYERDDLVVLMMEQKSRDL